MTPIEQAEPICKRCGEMFSVRSGMELTDYCDSCAQALVKSIEDKNKRLREALAIIQKSVTMGDDGRLEIDNEETFVKAFDGALPVGSTLTKST